MESSAGSQAAQNGDHRSRGVTVRTMGPPQIRGSISIPRPQSSWIPFPAWGPVTAQRILDHRRSIGRFTSVDQLLDVSGIGAKTLTKIRPWVRV